ncbi:MAG: DUF2782 domain-containing protein [Gammaproteobacteria bacterium]|nr:DUF2782 domain-containing protein [Gammaproteobacteria bacterium]
MQRATYCLRVAAHWLGLLILGVGLHLQVQAQEETQSKNSDANEKEEVRSVQDPLREPPPEIREPPPEVLVGPTVVLRTSERRTVYEFRVNGRLTRIKVVPKNGRPYYLIPVDRTETMGEFRQNSRLQMVWEVITF